MINDAIIKTEYILTVRVAKQMKRNCKSEGNEHKIREGMLKISGRA